MSLFKIRDSSQKKPQTDIVRFDHVGLQYGDHDYTFKNVNFSLKAGSFHFLTGASGSGKSSLLKLMYLGLRNFTGSIHLFGHDLRGLRGKDLPYFRQKIGVVFQEFKLLEHMTALENVALPLRVAGIDQRRSEQHAAEILRWVGLEECLESYPVELSGGQKQRVAIARAVINKPQILLADEPTGNVDDQIAVKLLYLFEELNKHGTTVVVATHSQELTQRFHYPVLHLENHKLNTFKSSNTLKGTAQ